MVNNNTFELSDEQLEAVTGGDGSPINLLSTLSAGNTFTGLNIAEGSTANFSGFNINGSVTQSGSTFKQGIKSTQNAGNA